MTILELLAVIPGMALMWKAFSGFNDVPNFDWETMKCIHPGNKWNYNNGEDN